MQGSGRDIGQKPVEHLKKVGERKESLKGMLKEWLDSWEENQERVEWQKPRKDKTSASQPDKKF